MGRAAKQAVAKRRDRAVQPRAPGEIVLRLCPQEVGAVALAVLGEAEGRVRALQVVDRGDRTRGIAKRRMRGDVVNALRADVDRAAVAQRLEVLISAFQHDLLPCRRSRSNGSRAGCSPPWR